MIGVNLLMTCSAFCAQVTSGGLFCVCRMTSRSLALFWRKRFWSLSISATLCLKVATNLSLFHFPRLESGKRWRISLRENPPDCAR